MSSPLSESWRQSAREYHANRLKVPAANHAPSKSPTSKGWQDKIVTARALQTMTFKPVRYILPGYITEGATIIAGKPKVGKSWLTLDLAIAATSERFTLGTLKPTQGDVLYLALEDNHRRLQRRIGKLWPNGRPSDRLALVTDWKRADEGGIEDINDWCTSVADPVMVIVDTLEKFRPLQSSRANAYSADYAAVTGLQKIAGERRVAVVINHHVRKMDADDPFDTVSGTLGLTGAADFNHRAEASSRRRHHVCPRTGYRRGGKCHPVRAIDLSVDDPWSGLRSPHFPRTGGGPCRTR